MMDSISIFFGIKSFSISFIYNILNFSKLNKITSNKSCKVSKYSTEFVKSIKEVDIFINSRTLSLVNFISMNRYL